MSNRPEPPHEGERDAASTRSADAGQVGPETFGDRRFRTMVEQVRDFAIFMMDVDGRHVTWNEGVLRLTGYEETEFLGLSGSVLFTPEDRARGEVERELRTAVTEGRASDDRWLVRKNGSRFWAAGITTRLNDDTGQLIGFSKMFRDLTAEKEAQDRLRESEDRLRVALLAARMGIWRWHLPTNTQRVDSSMARLLGLGRGDVVESYEQFREHIHPEDRVKVDAAFSHAIQSGEDMHVEFRVIWPDGSIRWLLDHGMLVRDQEGVAEYLTGAAIDVTERKLAEERLVEAQRMDAVGQLAGGVAHEINNMMTAALGFSDLLLYRLGPNDSISDDVRQIRRAASRAATITGQLLAFSRRQILQPQLLDLNSLVRGLEPMLRQVLGEDKLFLTDLTEDLDPVRADPGQMEQVLINLALNARDALTSGGSLTVRTSNAIVGPPQSDAGSDEGPPPGSYVVLAVTDTGHGMDAATRARVFEPFFTTKPVGQGTGLGLATVFGIVRQSGGMIRVESAPGEGTTFSVFLPAVSASAASAGFRSRETVERGSGTVLVVEDEDLLREFACRFLNAQGYRCLEASNGEEALEVVRQRGGEIDAIVTDVVMPIMGGRELTERVAELHLDIPVLFISAYTGDDMARRGLIEPGAPFLQKPFTPEGLARKLRELLKPAGRPGSGP
jgi:two-component system, cell cycle sensor histidine kinase and response regulator CckA